MVHVSEQSTPEGEKVSDIESLVFRVQQLNQSLDWWNTAMVYALVFTALAAIAVVLTTRIALTRAKQLADAQELLIHAKDEQLALDLRDKDLKIAEANQRADEAKVELAKFKAPRTLTAEQQARIASSLRQFPQTTFDVATSNAKEPINLVAKIEETLETVGWKELDWSATTVIERAEKPKLGLAVETGVTIQVEIAEKAKLLDVAKALARALTAEGIMAEAQLMPVPQTNNHDSIHIVVGEKPQ